MQFTQSVDFPLTQKDTCTLSGQLQTQNGTGTGGVNLSWRHIFSHKSWAEMEFTAGIQSLCFRFLSGFQLNSLIV